MKITKTARNVINIGSKKLIKIKKKPKIIQLLMKFGLSMKKISECLFELVNCSQTLITTKICLVFEIERAIKVEMWWRNLDPIHTLVCPIWTVKSLTGIFWQTIKDRLRRRLKTNCLLSSFTFSQKQVNRKCHRVKWENFYQSFVCFLIDLRSTTSFV